MTWPPLGPSLNESAGDWTAYSDLCYERYYADFYRTRPTWPVDGKRFNIKRHPELQGRCATFWHMTSEGGDEANRTPALDRCERVSWPRLMLDEFTSTYPARASARIVWWVVRRGSEDRYVIALADFSYVVIVADRGDYVLLWTAYPVEFASRRRKFGLEYEAYWANS